MKKQFSKQNLIKLLIIVSIITIFVIGLNQLDDLSPNFYKNLSDAAKSVIIPFSIAFLLSFLISPLAHLIESKTRLNRNISIIVSILIGIIFVLGIFSVTLTFVVMQLISVTIRLIDYLDNESLKIFIQGIIDTVQSNVDISSFEELIANFENYGFTPALILDWLATVLGGFKQIASSIVQVFIIMGLTPVFMFYLIKDKETIFNGLLHVFPDKTQKHIKVLGHETDKVIKNYFLGYGMVMLFITGFFIISYSILSFFIPGFSVWHAILFAIIMGLFSIIPYIGVWIAMAMPIVLFLSLHFEASDPGYIYIIGIVLIFILNIIEEALESTLVQPRVYSKKIRIHPLAVLSSFIFFGSVFGLVGFILAVPIAGTVKVTFHYFKEVNKPKSKSEQVKDMSSLKEKKNLPLKEEPVLENNTNKETKN